MTSLARVALYATLLLAGCDDSTERGDFAGLVDIGGGRKLYLECEGEGTPVVVLIPGKGGPARATVRAPQASGSARAFTAPSPRS